MCVVAFAMTTQCHAMAHARIKTTTCVTQETNAIVTGIIVIRHFNVLMGQMKERYDHQMSKRSNLNVTLIIV